MNDPIKLSPKSVDEIYVYNLLKRFTENDLTPEESRELRAIIMQSGTDPVIYRVMDEQWARLDRTTPFTELQAELVYERITKDPRFVASSVKRIKAPVRFYWAKIAASLLLMGVLVGGGYTVYMRYAEKQYAVYEAPMGQRVKMKLSDGSDVWMNAGTTIRVAKDFGEQKREVYLDGEAFFDVKHDAAKPFIVHTGSLHTQVLGTAFNILAYGKELVQVTVSRGKVGVNDAASQLGLLLPNRQLTYTNSSKKVTLHAVSAGLYTSWTQGELVLNNVTMEEASKILGRWYNVKFKFSNAQLKKCRFVISFPNNVEIGKVMNAISKLNDFTYTINENTISISGKGCN